MSVQDTSRAAYDAISASLYPREKAVWDALSRCTEPPTAYELFKQMEREGTATDLNSVRPRLTTMSDVGGCVESVGKRPCKVTGKLAMTWRVKVGHPPQPRTTQPHDLNKVEPNPETGRLW